MSGLKNLSECSWACSCIEFCMWCYLGNLIKSSQCLLLHPYWTCEWTKLL